MFYQLEEYTFHIIINSFIFFLDRLLIYSFYLTVFRTVLFSVFREHVLSGPFPGCLTMTLRTSAVACGMAHVSGLLSPWSGIHTAKPRAVRAPGRKGTRGL